MGAYFETDLRLSDDSVADWPTPTGKVRRVAWLDQRGRIYREIPSDPVERWRGGSYTPLLFALDDD